MALCHAGLGSRLFFVVYLCYIDFRTGTAFIYKFLPCLKQTVDIQCLKSEFDTYFSRVSEKSEAVFRHQCCNEKGVKIVCISTLNRDSPPNLGKLLTSVVWETRSAVIPRSQLWQGGRWDVVARGTTEPPFLFRDSCRPQYLRQKKLRARMIR